jgi:transcriptional regulator with XRE-family HTH domain
MVVAMNQRREDLPRLASYVVDARLKAGFSTRKEFADATGVTARTLGKLETASERVSSETLARVAEKLHWTPDSPALIMSGQEPVPAGTPAPPRPDVMYRHPLHDAETVRRAKVLFPDDPALQAIWLLDEPEETRIGLVKDYREIRRALLEEDGSRAEGSA